MHDVDRTEPPGPVLVDAHCHVWRHWPYQAGTVDDRTRAAPERLLAQLDRHGIGHAFLVLAALAHNEDNNFFGLEAVRRWPDRFSAFVDVDSSWSGSYHLPGSADRLRRASGGAQGVAHYLGDVDDGWLTSVEGLAFLQAAHELGLMLSLHATPGWLASVRSAAQQVPGLTVLLHHLGWPSADPHQQQQDLTELTRAAAVPNIAVKVSGFHYASEPHWAFPFPAARDAFRRLYDAFGPERLLWGSDFPVCERFVTYEQTLEVVRSYCDWLPEHELALVLGGNAQRLLAAHTRTGGSSQGA